MRILICLGNVPDTTTKVKFVSNTAFDTTGVQWVINPWDELSLTRALELKDDASNPVSEVSVINVGTAITEPTIRKALAIGADNAIRVNAEPADSYTVAAQIAAAIASENFDIILCGIESSDYNGSAVGSMLSEFLDMPSISAVSGIHFDGNNLLVQRDIDGGKEILLTSTPFVAIVQKGITKEPRIPSMRGIMAARTKPLKVIEPAAIEALTGFVSFELPPSKAACKMVAADNVKELVRLLHEEAKVI
jgi:electron transfer flavoprotein beta subunit